MATYVSHTTNYEYYEKINNSEIYATTSGGSRQIYAKQKFTEYYAKNDQDEPYYAKIRGSEYYAINKYRDEILIKIGNTEYYAKRNNNAEFYPKKRYCKEFLAKKDGTEYYVKDLFNNEVYPKDQYGNEYKISETHFAKLYNGEIFYPKDSKGNPIYDKDGNKEKYHFNSNKEPIFAKNICGDDIYAKDESMTEYYPLVNETPVFAKDKNNHFKYAKNDKGEIVYPTINNDQIYISDISISSYHVLKESNFLGFVNYVQNNKKEIYPTILTHNRQRIQMIVNNSYAKDLSTGEYYYPLDSNNNEYVTNDGEFIKTAGYPITNDGLIIIPNINNAPKLIKNNVEVTENHIKNLLYRPIFHTYDFLTNKKSSRMPNTSNLVIYNTLPNNLYFKKINLYVIAGLIFIIFILIFMLI